MIFFVTISEFGGVQLTHHNDGGKERPPVVRVEHSDQREHEHAECHGEELGASSDSCTEQTVKQNSNQPTTPPQVKYCKR